MQEISQMFRVRAMNHVSSRIHEVNHIYTEINELIVIEGFPVDNDITGFSKECVGYGHTQLTEKGDDRCEDVYSTVCKEKFLYKNKVRDDGKQERHKKQKRYTFVGKQ